MVRAKGRPRVRAKGQAHRHSCSTNGNDTAVLPVCEPQG